jgi:hypothetical protein
MKKFILPAMVCVPAVIFAQDTVKGIELSAGITIIYQSAINPNAIDNSKEKPNDASYSVDLFLFPQQSGHRISGKQSRAENANRFSGMARIIARSAQLEL